MLRLPPTVGVKLQLKVSDSIAHDGTQLEWLSVSEGSSEEYSGDESNYSEESESILISDTDQQLLFKGDLGTVLDFFFDFWEKFRILRKNPNFWDKIRFLR